MSQVPMVLRIAAADDAASAVIADRQPVMFDWCRLTLS